MGNEETNVNSKTRICLNDDKDEKQFDQFYLCSKCLSGMYCFRSYQVADYRNLKTVLEHRSTLENQRRNFENCSCCLIHLCFSKQEMTCSRIP